MSSERSRRTRTQTTFFEFDKEDTKNAANKAKQTSKAKPKKQEEHIAWFHKMIAPKFDGECIPSWNLVLDLAERKFSITKKVSDDLFALYTELEEATLSNIEDIEETAK